MADVIAKLQVDSSQYDQRLKSAIEQMTKMEKEVRRTGVTFAYANKEELEFIKSLGSMETKTTSAKSQLREYTEALMQMTSTYRNLTQEEKNSDWGKALAASMDEIKSKAAELQDIMGDTQAEIKSLASDTSAFSSITQGVSVVTASFQVAQGAMTLFGSKNQDMVKVIAKLQAAMAITNGLITIQTALQKQSNVMTGINTVQKKAAAAAEALDTAAKGKNLVVTGAATMAQKVFNMVAAANPYVLLATAIGAVTAALMGFTFGTEEATDAEKKANEEAEERKRKLDKVGESIGAVLAKYKGLQMEWKRLSTEEEKKTWIEQNKNAFEELGLAIHDVVSADKAFVTSSASVVTALQARAKANAVQELYQSEYSEKVKNAMTQAEALARGYKMIFESGGGFSMENRMVLSEKYGLDKGGVKSKDYVRHGSRGSFSYTLSDQGLEKIRDALFKQFVEEGGKAVDKMYTGLIESSLEAARKAAEDADGLVTDPEKGKGWNKAQDAVNKPQEQAENKVKSALEDYANSLKIAALRKEAGLDDEEKYKSNELAAHERLLTAYAQAYALYSDPKYKEAFDNEAEQVKSLSEAVKGLKDAAEQAEKDAQEDKRKKEEALRQQKQLDSTILRGLIGSGKQAKMTAKDLGLEGFKAQIDLDIDIPDEEWKVVQDKLNERRAQLGLEPVQINFETGNIEDVINEAKERMQKFMSDMGKGIGAVSTIGNAFNDLKGIGEDLADAFSGDMDTWDALMTVFNSGISIMQTVMGVMEAINTLQELSSTLSKKKVTDQAAETTAVVSGKGAEATANLQEAGTSMTAAGANAAESSSAAGKAVAGIPIVGPVLAIAAIAAVLAATFAAMSKAKSAGNFSSGGIVPGNSYSGDNLTIGVNSQELVLNRAQTSNLANQLQSNNQQGGGASSSFVTGENIVMGVNNFLGRSGQGEIVTTSMLRRAGINL